MLKVDKLTFAYPKMETPVFENISFDVSQGEVCAIIGKNGCGKTTLIKCLIDIHSAQQGEIDVVSPTGYVPQSVNLVYGMSVLDAIVMGRYQYIGAFSLPQKSDYEIARDSAERLNISYLLEKDYTQLSGGQQQLVLVARALAVESRCIVFDEPCSALDYGNQNHILTIIGGLRESKTTAVFSTHDPNHVIHIADKVLVMKDTGDFLFGSTEEMMTDQVLSALYEMNLKKVKVDDRITSVVALFD